MASTLTNTPSRIELPGFRDVVPLFRSERTIVHRATRVDGNLTVALKSVSPGAKGKRNRWRLHHEFQILRALDLPGVPKAMGMLSTPLGTTLEVSFVRGTTLLSRMVDGIPIAEALTLGAKLARIVAGIHAAGITHRDINPSNVMVDPNGMVWLIDFGLATSLSRQVSETQGTGRLEGTLGYLSPEQTGRMNRSIDLRTDLYSLSATLYALLTGRAPVVGHGDLELVHATVARRPRHPCDLREEIPPVVGDLLLRLLEKDPEDRYQLASAVAQDLEAIVERIRLGGDPNELVLGTTDRRGTLLTPERLYGRDNAVRSLVDGLARTRTGERAVFALPGPTGIGKTALARELVQHLGRRGVLARGACDAVRRKPYAPLLGIMRQIVETIQGGSEDELAFHQRRFSDAIRDEGGLLQRVFPEIELLIGPQPPYPELPAGEAKQRVLDMLVRMLRAYHAPGTPLVLLIDDLQWVDTGTLDVLDRLLAPDTSGTPLVLLAWRSDEVDATHPLHRILRHPFQTIDLQPLSVEHVRHLLADALGHPEAEIAGLATRIHDKTGGNAFFVHQFLNRLVDDGVVTFDVARGRWSWSLETIDALPPTANVGELLARRISDLSDDAREVLATTACVGKEVALDELRALAGHGIARLGRGLIAAIDAGMLQSLGDAWAEAQAWSREDLSAFGEQVATGQVRFVHDAAYEAAIASWSAARRESVHLQVGRRRMAAYQEHGGEPFGAADQLSLAVDHLSEAGERDQAATLFLAASHSAFRAAAFRAALDYAELGVRLVGPDGWDRVGRITLDLHLAAAEASLLCPEVEERRDHAEVAMAHAADALDKVAVQRVRLRHAVSDLRFRLALDHSLAALRWVGVSIPRAPSKVSVGVTVLWMMFRARNIQLADLRALPINQDPVVDAAMQLLIDAAAPAYYAGTQLLPVMVCREVALTLRHGVSGGSAHAAAAWAFLLLAVRDDLARAREWTVFARELAERPESRHLAGKVEVLALGFVDARHSALRALVDKYDRARALAWEAGDAEYAALASYNRTNLAFLSGMELDEVSRLAEADLARCEELAQPRSVHAIAQILQLVACLRGEAPDPAVLSGAHFDPVAVRAEMEAGDDRSGLHQIAMKQAFLSLLFGTTEDLQAHVLDATAREVDTPASPDLAPFHLVAGLAWVRIMRERGTPHGAPMKAARKSLAFLERWAAAGPLSFAHKVSLLKADLADLQGRHDEAIRYYDEAIRQVRTAGILHEEAMCLEWAGRAAIRRRHLRMAQGLLEDARAAWLAWDGTARLPVLSELDGALLLGSESTRTTRTLTQGLTREGTLHHEDTQSIDVASVISASQAVSSAAHLDALIASLMRVILQNAGGDHALIALMRDDHLVVAAEASVSGDDALGAEIYPSSTAQAPEEVRPEIAPIIRRVARQKKAIVLDDAASEGPWFADTTIPPASVLCVPALKGNDLVAVVYVGHRDARRAFPPDRVRVVEVLASQAAISLENTLLFGKLEEALEAQTILTRAYERFTPPQFLSFLEQDNILDVRVGDQVLRTITILFIDICGFTGLAERLGSEDTFSLINRFLGTVQPSVQAHGGFVNAYLGDGVMALFADGAEKAVRAGLGILSALGDLNEELVAEGAAPLKVGIGLNTGPLMIGTLGSDERMVRGVVGDAVNVAARLETMTRQYDVPMLIGEETASGLPPGGPEVRMVGRVVPKGKSHPIAVYEVLDANPLAIARQKREEIMAWHAGVALFEDGRFALARTQFEACLDACPSDRPAALYIDRCLEGERSDPDTVDTVEMTASMPPPRSS